MPENVVDMRSEKDGESERNFARLCLDTGVDPQVLSWWKNDNGIREFAPKAALFPDALLLVPVKLEDDWFFEPQRKCESCRLSLSFVQDNKVVLVRTREHILMIPRVFTHDCGSNRLPKSAFRPIEELRTGAWGRMETYEVLWVLARLVRAKTVLEIGSGHGHSTSILGSAVREWGGRVISCDIVPCSEANERVRSFGLDSTVTFVVDDATHFIRTLADSTHTTQPFIDMVFEDDGHSYESTLGILVQVDRILVQGGIIVIDDYKLPEKRRAVEEFLKTRCYDHGMTQHQGPIGSSKEDFGFLIKRASSDAPEKR